MGGIVMTGTGVYQPTSIWFDVAHLIGVTGVSLLLLTMKGLNWFTLAIVALGVAGLLRGWWERRCYGSLGKPIISVREGNLVLPVAEERGGTLARRVGE